jgi:hypothetical protein
MVIKLAQSFFVIVMLLCSPSFNAVRTDSIKNGDDNLRLIKLYYENQSGEKGLTTYYYDKKGLMHRAHWELNDGSRSSENFYTYDDEEKLIKKYREFSDGINSTQLYNYNEKGNLISEHFNRSDGVTGTTDYEYDENEKLIKTICNGLAGWFYGTIIYNYDIYGRKVEGIIKNDEKNIGNINFEYDTSGNLIKEYWEFPGSWHQTFIYVYEEVKRD